MSFDSWRDFEKFKKESITKNRFIYSDETTKFLSNIIDSFLKRGITLPQGETLYRSQIGCDQQFCEGEYIISGFLSERMKPLPRKAKEGRCNPKGIPYLYLSNNKITAMSELRPHPGQHLSLAEFEVQKNLQLVNCNSRSKNYTDAQLAFMPPTSQEETSDVIWSRINDEFSTPISNTDDSSDYAPTQILTELIKSKGFDGLQFKSSLGEGINYILFNPDNVNYKNCKVMTTNSVSYDFSDADPRAYDSKIKRLL